MKQVVRFFNVDLIIILCVLIVLSGCGGGGGGESGSNGGGQNSNVTESVLHGSVGDGPIIGATVRVFDKDNNLLTEQASDNSANYQLSVRANRNAYPLTMEASGGQDIVSGAEPDFTLKSIVLTPANKKRVNINPYSTLIAETAANLSGGLTSANMDLAKQIVLEQMNFGFDQSLMSDPVTSGVDEKNIAMIVRSSEALGETVRRTRDTLQAVEPALSADQVISSLSADLVDGVVDGNGVVGVDARIAAVSSIASAQVLIEVMTGQLNVNGVDASGAMDNAVLVSMPNVAPGTSVNDLSVTSEILTQADVMLSAAQTVDVNPVFDAARLVLPSVPAGSQPVEVAATLPADVSQNLSTTLTKVATTSDAALESVNAVVRSGGVDEPASANTTPTISGSPLSSIEEGSAYSFVPTASDADGDALIFSVTNLPVWASFNPENGAISGTPGALDVGATSNIVLKVSDNMAQVALPAFSITVTSLPNTAPTISGSPLSSIEVGSAYSFVPTASDADGDALIFSVTNLPSWASFNATNGTISGTPGTLDVGVTNNVVIKVSDGTAVTELPAFNITVTAISSGVGTATLSWMPPTENTDGSIITDLAGYKIYYGTTAGNYTSEITLNNPGLSSYVVDNLAGGNTYYFVITAFTTSGLESEYSTVGSKFIP